MAGIEAAVRRGGDRGGGGGSGSDVLGGEVRLCLGLTEAWDFLGRKPQCSLATAAAAVNQEARKRLLSCGRPVGRGALDGAGRWRAGRSGKIPRGGSGAESGVSGVGRPGRKQQVGAAVLT